MIFKNIQEDIRAFQERDPAAKGPLAIFFTYPGFHAVVWHRLAHWFWGHKLFFIARLVSNFARWVTLIEIHPGAEIGKRLVIDHGGGVVIGETAEVGHRCLLYQGVTLGGTGKDHGKRHPTLAENVVVGAGAKVLGAINVGANTRIGAGSVVVRNVEADCTVVGIPGRVIHQSGEMQTVCSTGGI